MPNNSRYLVGVSGGRDSVALLHWLLSNGYDKLIVCHFEHGLRGRAGKGDARFVERLAQKDGLQYEDGSANIRAIAVESRRSIETAARGERLAFFARVARRRRCPTIFLGHHADDQVETFLLQLFRGAGGKGLAAMRAMSVVGGLRIVRPLLGIWGAEIDSYIKEHRLKFREDASNADLDARRNRMRHKMIPYLEKQFGRSVRMSLWRAASILAEEEELLDSLVPNEYRTNSQLATRSLRALPVALQRRAIMRWLRANEISNVGFDVIEKVRRLLDPSRGAARVNLPRDLYVRRRAGKLFLE